MYRTIEFSSGWPDDSQFDADGHQLAPGARDLAEVIAQQLAAHIESPPQIEQHSFYGWGFYCRYAGASYYCVFNPAGESGFLTVDYLGYFLDKLLWRKPRARFESFCAVVEAALRHVPNLSKIVWHAYRR